MSVLLAGTAAYRKGLHREVGSLISSRASLAKVCRVFGLLVLLVVAQAAMAGHYVVTSYTGGTLTVTTPSGTWSRGYRFNLGVWGDSWNAYPYGTVDLRGTITTLFTWTKDSPTDREPP